jgi:hypothetical protein
VSRRARRARRSRCLAGRRVQAGRRDRGERFNVGDTVAYRTAHPTGAELVEQFGTVVELGEADGEPAAAVAWVTGGRSGPIRTVELERLE